MITLQAGKPLPYHANYNKCDRARKFYELSYEGGPEYKDGNDAQGKPVFQKHELDTADSINRRKSMALYANFCKPVVDRYNRFVFSNSIKRDATPAWAAWCKNVDLYGTTWSGFVQARELEAQKWGCSFVWVDTTKAQQKQTQAQAKAAGNRVWLLAIEPDGVVNWDEKRGVLTAVLIRFDDNTFALIDRTNIQRGAVNDTGKIVNLGKPTPHGWPRLPVVRFTANAAGCSQIKEIAEANKKLFNLDSLLTEELFNRTYTTQFAAGNISADSFSTVAVGSRKVVLVNAPSGAVQFASAGADPTQADSIRKSMTDTVNYIHAQAGLFALDSDALGQRASGDAIQIKFNELQLAAGAIADAAQSAENALIDLYNFATGQAVAPTEYPDSDEMDVTALAAELDRTFKMLESAMPLVLKQEQIRNAAKLLFPNLTPAQTKELESQLAAMPAAPAVMPAPGVMPMDTPENDDK